MDKKKAVALRVVKKLRQHGFSAYFVGGYVRDMLMRKAPKDIDIATDARPQQIKEVFKEKIYSVGAKFGTLLLVKGNNVFQISSFRGKRKSYSRSLDRDLNLRDFTINALAYEPIKKKTIDLVGGRKDIRDKTIRAVGDAHARFKEDPLRLIRAIRLECTLGFKIEKDTFLAIKEMAAAVKKVSRERLRDELTLIFTSANPGRGMKLLDESGLLKEVLPEVDSLKGVEQPRAFHPEGDVFAHTLLMMKKLKKPSLALAFSCLLHDIGKPATFQVSDRIRFSGHDKAGAQISDNILKRLRFSNKDRKDIVSCIENHMRMMEAPKMRESTLIRLFCRPTFDTELELHRIDCLASHKDLSVWRFLQRKYRGFKKAVQIPKPLLDGYELIKIGFTPGPIFGKIHRQLIDQQMEGKIKNKSQAQKWVCRTFIKEKLDAQT
ncbi:MAG: CCA tRNA nucleotidyltransferase [Candidatus Omnitrophica bacterium]|nr:CCA tRNA nucleotidyltransferase [Candidatus Omnitrophota bacterium]